MLNIHKQLVSSIAIASLVFAEAVLIPLTAYATTRAKAPVLLGDGASNELGPFVPNEPNNFKRVFQCGRFDILLTKIPNSKKYRYHADKLTMSSENAGFSTHGGTEYVFSNLDYYYALHDRKNGTGELEVWRQPKGTDSQTIVRESCKVTTPG